MRAVVGLLLAALMVSVTGPAQAADPFVKGQRPTPGSGLAQPWVGNGADGKAFTDLGEGRIRHEASGFICETSMSGFTRDRVVIFDASDGGRDVACRFSTEKSWFTLYFTRLPGMDDDEVFTIYVRQAQDVARPIADAESPLTAGIPPLPGFARHWKTSETAIDGLWLVQIGDWFVKLRVTYAPEDEETVVEAARFIFESVHGQVAPPEI